MLFLFFRVFTVSSHIRGPTVCVSHFAGFSVFLATFQVLSVCFSFSMSLRVSHDIPSPTVFRSPFPRLSLFSRYSIFLQCGCVIFPIFDFLGIYRSYCVHISFFKFFTVSCVVPGPTMWVSRFSHWSLFSPYSRSYSVCVSFSTFFSFLTIIQVLQCMFLLFRVFHCLSPLSWSNSVCVSFSRFSHFSSHIPGPTLCVFYFARFKCFLPYFMSYHVSFSFSLFLSFLAIFQVLLCEFLIFLFSQFSHHIPGPTVCIPHFPSFSFSFFLFLPYFKS